MEKEIEKIIEEARAKLQNLNDPAKINDLYPTLFGKNSNLAKITKKIQQLTKEQRPKAGQQINQAKKDLETLFTQAKKSAQNKQETQREIDVTAPGKSAPIGHNHLVTQAIEEIINIFKGLGFYSRSYPEIDFDYYAFEALNMPKDHPARDEWETFFVKNEPDPNLGKQVLTPHTSNGQVREMQRKKPPIRMINISRCYRRQIDVSHVPMFYQFEGLLVDKNVSISQLKGTFDFFTTNFFGPQRVTRLRPHHFRFTEPSFEVDVTCGICLGKGCRMCKSGWLELGGAGMVHPKVLKAGKIDPEIYQAFAFGWGVERTIAMKTSLPDLRLLYQNDIRFLEQF